PARFREGSRDEYLARLADKEQGALIRQAIQHELEERKNGQSLVVARYRRQPALQGKDLAAIAMSANKTPLEIVLEIERNGGAQMVSFGMSEEDVRLFMKQPWVATASDGSSQVPGD